MGWVAVLIPTGALRLITGLMYGFGAIWGIGAFMVVFFAGSWVLAQHALGKARGFRNDVQTRMDILANQIDSKRQEITDLDPSASDYNDKKDKLLKEIADLRTRQRTEQRKMQELAETGT